MNPGVLRVWPEGEMRAVDMAETLKALSTFSGIIEGCRLDIVNNALVMTPGKVMILGRVGTFEPDEGDTKITITCPNASANNTTYYVVIVCDLNNSSTPFYVDLKTSSQVSALDSRISSGNPDAEFNSRETDVRYLKIASVKVSTTGVPSNLDKTTGNFPQYAIVSNANYVDKLESKVDGRWTISSAWFQRFERTKHRTVFFRKNDIVANGITVPANSVATFQFRKEYDSQVIIKPSSGDATLPNDKPFIYINPDGSIVSGSGHQSAGPSPSTAKTYYEGTTVLSSLYEEWQNFGIVGIRIENASSGGAQANNCCVQSYYMATTGGAAEYVWVKVKNSASAQAKIKLTVTCLYIRNIDYPS